MKLTRVSDEANFQVKKRTSKIVGILIHESIYNLISDEQCNKSLLFLMYNKINIERINIFHSKNLTSFQI